jgi:predicted TIM-barrel fold metal-dependent hydrolase
MSYNGPIVDVDIHHRPKSEKEIIRYLPNFWQRYVESNTRAPLSLTPPGQSNSQMLKSPRRRDTFAADGSYPGSDYETLRRQLLDPFNYFRGILTHDVGGFAVHMNPHFSRVLSKAVNDWNRDVWLSIPGEDRLYSVIVVPIAEPEEAAKEIRRVGRYERFVGVWLVGNPLGLPFGHPIYHPIYEAAAEMNLMVGFHGGGGDRPNPNITYVGGVKGTFIEHLCQYGEQAMSYISSLITNGVFEKYPGLKVIFKEYGIGWLPTLMWRLDDQYRVLRLESTWVKKRPSEYIRDHVKLSTQPIEEGPERSSLERLLGAVEGMEELLVFSTDYPHVTMDEPTYVRRLLPAKWHRKVFLENACSVYGWIPPASMAQAPLPAIRTG